METYRRGHNGADSKSVCLHGHASSNLAVSAKCKKHPFWGAFCIWWKIRARWERSSSKEPNAEAFGLRSLEQRSISRNHRPVVGNARKRRVSRRFRHRKQGVQQAALFFAVAQRSGLMRTRVRRRQQKPHPTNRTNKSYFCTKISYKTQNHRDKIKIILHSTMISQRGVIHEKSTCFILVYSNGDFGRLRRKWRR